MGTASVTFQCQERPSSLGIIRSRFYRIVLKGQLWKKSSLFSENTYKYPVILFSVKLMIKEWQILLSELIHVQLFQQYICKITIFLSEHISDVSGERGLDDLIKGTLGNPTLQLVFVSLFFYFIFLQESPNAAAGACLRKTSPLCWWWCHWISVST